MKSSNNRVITVGLLWHSVNSDNLGVGALTASHVAILEQVARDLGLQPRFKVLGWRDKGEVYIERDDLDAFPMRARDLVRPGGLYREVRRCDMVLDISAGDSFADIYGSRRFVFNALSKLVVLAARRPLLLSPQTIGPFQRAWASVLAAFLMRAAKVVVTRDRLTTEFLARFRLGSKLVEATDVAFRLPYDRPQARLSGPARFGFNVSGLLFNGGYTRNNMFGLEADYPALARSIIDHFSSLPDCEVHLIGHVNSERIAVEDDYRVCERLKAEFPNVVLAPRFKTPSAAKSYIATMDFFCGSRMHACIAAFSSGVPVLPIAYSRKFAGLFGTLDYPWLADCKAESKDEIMAKLIQAYAQRSELKARTEDSSRRAGERLAAYEAVLRDEMVQAVRNGT